MGICASSSSSSSSSNENRNHIRGSQRENNNEHHNQVKSDMNSNQIQIAKTLQKKGTLMGVAQSNHLDFPKGKALLFSRQEE
jgi:hypothetical protein